MSDPFPDWSKPATKADVIRLGIRLQQVLVALAKLTSETNIAGPNKAALLEEVVAAAKDVSALIDEFGGVEK